MTTIVNRGDWVRGTTISTNANIITAWHVREFVKAMDREGIPDSAQIDDRHAADTQHLTGLRVHIEDRRPDERAQSDEVPS